MSGGVYYNEIDPFAAQWLRNLAAAGHIPAGDIDERSILDVAADDLRGYGQCHFFAGIGGWSHALRLAGWPDDRPVWTGSCPCQPLSSEGQRKGHADERHLWPAFYRLIALCRPATVFGEQVGGALGREWLAGVRADLEVAGYAVGAADLSAAGVGAPHIRRRLFWVADARCERDECRRGSGEARGQDLRAEGEEDQRQRRWPNPGCGSGPVWVADAETERRDRSPHAGAVGGAPGARDGEGHQPAGRERSAGQGATRGLADSDASGQPRSRRGISGDGDASCLSAAGDNRRLGDAGGAGPSPSEREKLPGARRLDEGRAAAQSGRSFWANAEWLPCLDGKARRAQPGIFPLADGLPGRVGKLRASGNAIVPQVAAEFIAAFCDIEAA